MSTSGASISNYETHYHQHHHHDDYVPNEEIDHLNEQFEIGDNEEEIEIEEADDRDMDPNADDHDQSLKHRPSERNSILSVRNLNSIFQFSFEGKLATTNYNRLICILIIILIIVVYCIIVNFQIPSFKSPHSLPRASFCSLSC